MLLYMNIVLKQLLSIYSYTQISYYNKMYDMVKGVYFSKARLESSIQLDEFFFCALDFQLRSAAGSTHTATSASAFSSLAITIG